MKILKYDVVGDVAARGVGVGTFYPSPHAPAMPDGRLAVSHGMLRRDRDQLTRIALMGLHPEHFEIIFGAVGAGVASFLALVAIVGINLIRVREDLLARS